MPGPKPKQLVVTYETIADLTDGGLNHVHQAAAPKAKGRQRLDIDSLESVVLWLAGHANLVFRRRSVPTRRSANRRRQGWGRRRNHGRRLTH